MKSVLLRVLCLALALVLLCLPGCTKNPDEEKTPPDESGTALPAPNGLNVNLLDAPFGVDRNALRFSWVMNAPGNNQTPTSIPHCHRAVAGADGGSDLCS